MIRTLGALTVREVERPYDPHRTGVLLELDEKDRLLGIEVLHASRHYPGKWLRSLGDPATWLTLREAAAESQAEGEPISTEQLRGLLNAGKLEGRKVGRDWQIAVHVLWNYLENRPRRGRVPGPASDGGEPIARRTRKRKPRGPGAGSLPREQTGRIADGRRYDKASPDRKPSRIR